MDIWHVYYRVEYINNGQLTIYRVIKTIKGHTNNLDALYAAFNKYCYENSGVYSLVFARNPDETMFAEKEETHG